MIQLHELTAESSPGIIATMFYLAVYIGAFFLGPAVGAVMAVEKHSRDLVKYQAEARSLHDEAVALLKQADELDVESLEVANNQFQRAKDMRYDAKDRMERGQKIVSEHLVRDRNATSGKLVIDYLELAIRVQRVVAEMEQGKAGPDNRPPERP